MELARFMAVAFVFFFLPSALIYCIVQRICAFFSPELREMIRRQSWFHFLLVPATSAAIMMMLCIRVGAATIHAAKMAQTTNEANQIQTAILGYYTEYSELPHSTDNATLIKILTGNNQRGIAFLSIRPKDMNAKGEMVDAWQNPFHISFADPDHPTVTSDMLPSPSKSDVDRSDH